MKHRHQAGQDHYRVVGYDPIRTTCDFCGKRDLDGTIVLENASGDVKRAGSDCAANLTGGRPAVLLHRAKKLSLQTPSGLSSPSTYHVPYPEILERADELAADSSFQDWLGESKLLSNSNKPEVYYRGVQQPKNILKGVRGLPSYTPIASAATIYSMRPGDNWGQRKPELLPTSTVQPAFIKANKPLHINDLTTQFGDFLRELRYGEADGITDEEVRKILNYLHNRQTGKAKGGDLLYKIVDEDGDEVEIDFGDVLHGRTQILNLRDDIEMWPEDTLEIADRLHAETYALCDAPMTKKVAERLGHDAFIYTDPFHPGEASEILFDKPDEELEGVGDAYNLEDDEVATIETIRPFSAEQIRPIIPGGVSTTTFLHGLPDVPKNRRQKQTKGRRR